uniref:Uncharacterized protein n=1 Tax=Macrostomum lignano TaxID=282301 RepID=A0A1I8FEU9_9PLAT
MELRTSIALALTRQQLPATRPHPAPRTRQETLPRSSGGRRYGSGSGSGCSGVNIGIKRRSRALQQQRQQLQRWRQPAPSGRAGRVEQRPRPDVQTPDVPAAVSDLRECTARDRGGQRASGDVCSSQSFEQDIAEFAR